MSYRNKGSIAATVTVSRYPDQSGNFICSTAEAHDVTIQRAIDRVNTLGGGRVVLLNGIYTISTTINMVDNLILEGVGVGSTILQVLAGANLSAFGVLRIGDSVNVEIGHMGLNGNDGNGSLAIGVRSRKTVDPGECEIYLHDLHIHNMSSFGIRFYQTVAIPDVVWRVERCYVYDCGNAGIYCSGLYNVSLDRYYQHTCFAAIFDNCHDCSVEDSKFKGSDGTVSAGRGLRVEGGCSDFAVSGCHFIDNADRGCVVSSGAGVTVSNSTAYNNTSTGFTAGNPATKDIIFSGCVSHGNGGAGFSCSDDAEHVSFIGNTAFENDYEGILLPNDNCIADGNRCWDNGQIATANRQSGIGLGYPTEFARYCVITNNTCWDGGGGTQLYGIMEIHSSCNYNLVNDNMLIGNHTGALYLQGSNTLAYGNRVDGTSTIAIGVNIPEIRAKSPNPDSNIGDHPAQQMADSVDTYIYEQIPIPLEYQELITAQIIVVQDTAANPNMVWTVDTDWGKICSAEDYFTHTDSAGATSALAQNDLVCLDISAALDGIAQGDLVGVSFMRDGDNIADTVGGPVYYLGIRVRYV